MHFYSSYHLKYDWSASMEQISLAQKKYIAKRSVHTDKQIVDTKLTWIEVLRYLY